MSFITGILIALASPIYNIELLIPVMLSPWFFALNKTKKLKEAVLSGLIVSLTYGIVIYNWVPETLVNFYDFTELKSWLIFIVSASFFKISFIIYAILYYMFKDFYKDSFLIKGVVVSLLYVAIELISPTMFYDTLGHYLYDINKLNSIVFYLGVYSLTFIIVYLSYLFNHSKLYFIMTLGGTILFLNLLSYTIPVSNKTVKAMLVQPILSLDTYKMQNKNYNRILNEILFKIENDYNEEKVIILPETILPNDVNSFHYDYYKERFESLAKKLKTNILIGGKTEGNENSIFLMGNYKDYSSKEFLFPFGEYLPMESLTSKILPKVGDIPVHKERSKVFKLDDLNILPLICYESVHNQKFYKKRNQYNLIINPTNEVWFGEKGTRLTEALTRIKAYESNVDVVRVSTKGSSGVYSLTKDNNIFKGNKKGVFIHSVKVNIGKDSSFYMKYFNYIKILSFILLGVIILWFLLVKKQNN